MTRTFRTLTESPASRTLALVFGLNSFLLANLFVRLPALQSELGLTTAEIGLALMGLSAGSILAMLTSGRLVARMGASRVTWGAALLLCLVSPLPALAGNVPELGAALTVLGLVNGTVAVAMNAAATVVEERRKSPAMASFHAMFSLGGIAGAGTGSALVALGLAPSTHLLLLGAATAIVVLMRSGTLPSLSHGERSGAEPSVARPHGRLAVLAAICLATMLCEGAASDWSALYLAHELGATQALAAMAYVFYATGMTIGRLRGDALRDQLGDVGVVSGGALLAAIGLGTALLLRMPIPALVGFGCLGLGLSGIVPIIFRKAAAVPGMAPATAISAVASVGFAGFLTGPPVIGLLAQHLGLDGALAVVPILALCVALAGLRLLGPSTMGQRPAGRDDKALSPATAA
jgi:predicted MFS family arabinose efflux permease